MSQDTSQKKMQALAEQALRLCQEELISSMPYMDRVLLSMPVEFSDPDEDPEAMIGFGTDGEKIYSTPSIIVDIFMAQRERLNRMYFHTLLHCLFLHMFAYDRLDQDVWDMCADMAVENIILDLHLPAFAIEGDNLRHEVLLSLFPSDVKRNADAFYDRLMKHPRLRKQAEKYIWLFRRDRHDLWKSSEKVQYTEKEQQKKERWDQLRKDLSESMQSYEEDRGLKPGSLTRTFHLEEEKAEDYRTLLRRFLQNHEEIHTDPDSFDYAWYMYGLSLYKNMPLIEPLEYRQSNRIHDFVLAVDTSGSTQGEKIRRFLEQTYGILHDETSFQEEMNVHIMQCDAVIQEEKVINSIEELSTYMHNMKIHGMGGTDFRPVFRRVEDEITGGVFHDLRGLIYFTDGHGTFPSQAPSYPCLFVIDDNEVPADIPSWAVCVRMNEDKYEY